MRVGGLLENAAVVMERASRTRDAIHAVMAVVAEQSGADAAWLRSNGESLERRLDSLSAVIAPMDGSGFGGGRSASGELRSVYGSMNSSWDAPTETQRIRIAAAETALSDGVEALNEFLEDGMAAYRERANEAGLRLIPDFPALSVPRG